MDASDFLPHRAALIGAAIAVTVGLTSRLALRVGAQTAPAGETAIVGGMPDTEAEPIVWPSGKTPDYVIGSDFLRAQQPEPPVVVVGSYEVPEYAPPDMSAASADPTSNARPVRLAEAREPSWPSISGDILNTRLPEDAPSPPAAPEAVDALEPPAAVTLAAAN